MASSDIKVNVTADTSQIHAELDKVAARIKRVKDDLKESGIVPALFGFFGGRCTTFAIAFFVIGVFLELRGKLDPSFVALAGIIQALILAHSAKEDYHERNGGGNTNVNVSVESK